MPKFGIETGMDWSESDGIVTDGGPQELRTNLAKNALKTANKRLHRSTRGKNPVILYEYNEYMAIIMHT